MKRRTYRDEFRNFFYYTGKKWYSWTESTKSFGITLAGLWVLEPSIGTKWWFNTDTLIGSSPLEFLLLTGEAFKKPSNGYG